MRTTSRSTSAASRVLPDGRAQELLCLRLVEAQLRGAQLEQLSLRAKARERQRRIVTRRDRELERRWQVREQKGDARVHLLALDQVVVVEHEHEPRVERGELVDQRWQDDLDRIGAADAERGQRRRPDRRGERAQRLDGVGPEAHGVVVGPVDREPGEGASLLRVGRPTPPAGSSCPSPRVRRAASGGEAPARRGARTSSSRAMRLRAATGAFSFVPSGMPAGNETVGDVMGDNVRMSPAGCQGLGV